jgi:hypothetical protein
LADRKVVAAADVFQAALGSGLLAGLVLLTPALKDSYVSIFETLNEEFGVEQWRVRKVSA